MLVFIDQFELVVHYWQNFLRLTFGRSTIVLDMDTIECYLTPRLKNSQGEEESGGGDSEYGCTRGTYLDSCIVFSESTLLCFNKCLIDYPTSLCRRKC